MIYPDGSRYEGAQMHSFIENLTIFKHILTQYVVGQRNVHILFQVI